MPWQIIPPVVIIGGAFSVISFGLPTVHWLFYRKNRRVQTDKFIWGLDNRDKAIKEYGTIQPIGVIDDPRIGWILKKNDVFKTEC